MGMQLLHQVLNSRGKRDNDNKIPTPIMTISLECGVKGITKDQIETKKIQKLFYPNCYFDRQCRTNCVKYLLDLITSP